MGLALIGGCTPKERTSEEAANSGTGGDASSTSAAGTTDASSSSAALEGSSESSAGENDDWSVPPDCATVDLPGSPQELSSTPRANRSAELLALATTPGALVAPDDAYAVIDGDLQAIASVVPGLEDIAPNCLERNRLQMWWHDSELPQAIWTGVYRAWDCHNAHFDVELVQRLDGSAYGFEFDKVLGDPVVTAYQSLPGFDDAELSWCWYNDDPCQPECSAMAIRNLELEAYAGPDAPRIYRFVRRTDADPIDVRYRVTADDSVELLP